MDPEHAGKFSASPLLSVRKAGWWHPVLMLLQSGQADYADAAPGCGPQPGQDPAQRSKRSASGHFPGPASRRQVADPRSTSSVGCTQARLKLPADGLTRPEARAASSAPLPRRSEPAVARIRTRQQHVAEPQAPMQTQPATASWPRCRAATGPCDRSQRSSTASSNSEVQAGRRHRQRRGSGRRSDPPVARIVLRAAARGEGLGSRCRRASSWPSRYAGDHRVRQLEKALECAAFRQTPAWSQLLIEPAAQQQVEFLHAATAAPGRAGAPLAAGRPRSMLAFGDHPLDLGDRLRRIQVLRTGFGAVHDRVAAIQLERIFQRVEPFARSSRRGCR